MKRPLSLSPLTLSFTAIGVSLIGHPPIALFSYAISTLLCIVIATIFVAAIAVPQEKSADYLTRLGASYGLLFSSVTLNLLAIASYNNSAQVATLQSNTQSPVIWLSYIGLAIAVIGFYFCLKNGRVSDRT